MGKHAYIYQRGTQERFLGLLKRVSTIEMEEIVDPISVASNRTIHWVIWIQLVCEPLAMVAMVVELLGFASAIRITL